MDTSLFDYVLPPDRIAQHSVEPRDSAKLLVLDRASDSLQDKTIRDLPSFLRAGDLLIFNNTKVFKARLRATVDGKAIELFLLRPDGDSWIALLKPAKKVSEGSILMLADATEARLLAKEEDGTARIHFSCSHDEVFALCDRVGEIPVPPYVKEQPSALNQYQTIYAQERGSVAAPTAGLHFTPSLFEVLEQKGVQKAFVTLHVGLGTFRPMKTRTLEEHVMHEEWFCVPKETLQAIQDTKKRGGRVIAVGTTAVRALESAVLTGPAGAHSGFTRLFITPGFEFKMIDGLLTNFHLPQSTLLVLVSSLAGRERILNAYQHAIDHGYRFYSFGDAMLIL